MLNLLVVEDHPHIRTILEKNLTHAGYKVFSASNGEEALALYESHKMDGIIADIMMPVMNGNTLVKTIRAFDSTTPIIMLTALGSYQDKEKSFTSGSDDYMVKPVDMPELLLRVKALLRRAHKNSKTQIQLSDMMLDYPSKSCQIEGAPVNLKLKEFELLYFLVAHAPQVFTRAQLLDEIWGYDTESYERTVDTHIKSLRQKITSNALTIETVRGLGYQVILHEKA